MKLETKPVGSVAEAKASNTPEDALKVCITPAACLKLAAHFYEIANLLKSAVVESADVPEDVLTHYLDRL